LLERVKKLNLNQIKTLSTNAVSNSIWERENGSGIFHHFGNKDLSLSELKKNDQIKIDGFVIPASQIVLAEQIHGNSVQIVSQNDIGAGITQTPIPAVDALITNEKNIFLAIKTADCVPILMFDPIIKVIAVVHSGREGTRKNIVRETLKILMKNFKSNPENILVKLGPSICEKCYEVDQNTFVNFVNSTGIEQQFSFLNIKKVLLHQLKEAGISLKNIENIDICTFEDENYFSYRRDEMKGRQISLIGMLNKDI